MERFKSIKIVFVLALLFGIHFELFADHLPYRKELRSDIKFWKKVFCETSSDQYIIHDSQYLSVIYTVITFESTVCDRTRSRQLKKIKEKYENLLLKLHHSDQVTSNLAGWEKTVFDQFKSINEKDKFRIAARRIRAQQGIKEKFVSGLERSFSYLPLMAEIFKRQNLPIELIYLPHIESSFNISAGSKAGAKGMWQFMWSTGRYYLRMNRIVDQRFDPIYSSEAAAKLLKRNYTELQDWALAVTAYNHGLAGMKRAKHKFNNDYLEIREGYLKRSFGFASKNFYPEFLAVVEIMDSLQYYFPLIKQHPDYAFKEITLENAVNVPQLVKHLQIDTKELKRLNPAYKNVVWRGQRTIPKGYNIRFPIDVDMGKILTFANMNNKSVEKPLTRNVGEQSDYLDLPVFSFSKNSVQNNDFNFDTLFDFLSANKPVIDKENTAIELASFNKPVVEEDKEIRNTSFQLNWVFRDDESGIKSNANLFTAVFAKPEVNYDEVNISDYQFNFENSKFASASSTEMKTQTENHIVFKDTEDKNEYVRVSNTVDNITVGEIKRILESRLKIRRNEIIIFPSETLGHIAEWLNVSAAFLRSLNNLRFNQKIYSGQSLRLDFSLVSPDEFTELRLKYHMNLINKMLKGKHELKLVDYTVNPGESLWKISRDRNNFPVNLLLYFNDLNKLEQLYPGDIIKLPII